MVFGQEMRRDGGFTLVEIMMVVVLIAMLTLMAIAAFSQYRKDSQETIYMSKLRVIRDAAESYYIKNNQYPPEAAQGVVPVGLSNYISSINWSERTAIGGYWDWDAGVFGVQAAITLVGPDRTTNEMARIDKLLDDGNLTSGKFRISQLMAMGGGLRYMYVLSE